MNPLSLVQKIAQVAKGLTVLIWILAIIALVSFGYLIFAADPSLDPYILPSIVALAWAVCLQGIARNFSEVPSKPDSSVGFFRRIRMRISYGIAWFWAAFFLVTSVILIYMSIRSVSLIVLG